MTGGHKFDSEKLRYDLVPLVAYQSLAEVFTYGAKKYGERNWEKGISKERLRAALLRHVFAWCGGEDADAESDIHHLAHAMANLAMMMALPDEWDDRSGKNGA